MGAVKRTHKQARKNQEAYKFARRYPDKYEKILKEVMLQIVPVVSEVVKEVFIALRTILESNQEVAHDERD